MKPQYIPFQNTGYFSKFICDYLDQCSDLSNLYGNFPDLNGFKDQIKQKEESYSENLRQALVADLKRQAISSNTSDATVENIDLLTSSTTFTITTGHQLNIFTGPLYFLYKIGTAINLAKKLKTKFPNYNFVPVYWMATEDHDFEEIAFFNFKGKKMQWASNGTGAVGRMETTGLEEVLKKFTKEAGTSDHAKYLSKLFEKAYLGHEKLADATRYLVNELFGSNGLVIIDGDSPSLKEQFKPFVKEELLNNTSFKEVSKTNTSLQELTKIQVNPREINLFYLKKGLRERIVFEANRFKVNGTELSFTKDEILIELEQHPERFSPNVILRPLYQEVILPNLCYIGGGGELAYWLQLKSFFESQNVPFPILMLRQSVVFIKEKQLRKLDRLDSSIEALFLKQAELVDNHVRKISEVKIDFSDQKSHLIAQFEKLKKLAQNTDKSFTGAVLAQEKKQLNGLNVLEKRLLKAQKKRLADTLIRLTKIQDELFPNNSLEERTRNFSEYYLLYGPDFIPDLLAILNPLHYEFTIAEIQ